MRLSRTTLACASLLLVAASACGAGDRRPADPTAADATGRRACGGVGAPAPLVVDAQPETRMDLGAAMRNRLAVVAFDCHSLRVLPDCWVDGGYRYLGGGATEQLVRMKTGDDIRAQLPLTGANLAGQLQGGLERGTSLDLALVMVGKHSSSRASYDRGELRGSCQDASHVVHSATVGAFSLSTGASAETRTVAELFGAGVTSAGTSSREVKTKDGDLAACKQASAADQQPPVGCGALLRVELAALSAAPPPQAIISPQLVEKLRGRFCPDPAACRASCEGGTGLACMHYGVLLMLGDRVPVNLSEGSRYLQRACDLGDMNGCTLVGISYLTEGPHADAERAYRYLVPACDAGVATACATLASSRAGAGDDEQARRYRQRACDLGDRASCQ